MLINRRKFIKNTALAGGVMAFPDVEENSLGFKISQDFRLDILATNWGFQGSMDQFCKKAKDEGYDGIEVWAPREEKDKDILMEAVAKYGLKVGFLAGNWGDGFKNNLNIFQEYVELATSYQPVFINCHSGKDFFTFDQNRQFIDFTTKISKSTGVPIFHETHRARILFAAHIAREYIEKIPELRLTLDISHWTCVAGSLLEDQQETVQKALERTDHIHSRVGLVNGPQIPDPRAPEFSKEVAAHFKWWDKVVEIKSEKGEHLTMTTEFGPPSYMWALPYTKQPVANLWEVNAHMMRLWRERYT